MHAAAHEQLGLGERDQLGPSGRSGGGQQGCYHRRRRAGSLVPSRACRSPVARCYPEMDIQGR